MFLLLICFAGSAVAQNPEDVFAQANQSYQANRFEEARDAYESLIGNGYESGELYFNLGNAYYRLGDIPRSILSYERAARLIPGDPDLEHNLQLAMALTTDRIESAPRLFLWDYWDVIKGAFAAGGILWITYGLFVALFVPAALLLFGRTYAARRSGLIALAIALPVFLFSLTVCVARISDLTRTDQAIVMSAVTSVKNSPDMKSSDAFVLHGGTRVTITDQIGGWVQIRLADGKTGWIEEKEAERI
jgi:tetratricopeptide (TPR) repeat protein